MRTVADALALGRALGIERIEGQWLAEHVLGRPRSWLAAHPEAPIDADRAATLAGLLARRADAEPLAYLLGEQVFRGLVLRVDRRVLVPRADSETLVDWAVERLAASAAVAPEVVDLGTGSGAVALAIARACPDARVVATDLSEAALEVARGNAARLGLAIRCRPGAWWDAVGGRCFDLAVSNPPYIAIGDAHLDALRHEPALALVSGADGLDAIRSIVRDAARHLKPGGMLLLEHGFDQAAAVRTLLVGAGFTAIDTRRDAGGRERCSGGVRAPR